MVVAALYNSLSQARNECVFFYPHTRRFTGKIIIFNDKDKETQRERESEKKSPRHEHTHTDIHTKIHYSISNEDYCVYICGARIGMPQDGTENNFEHENNK